MAISPELDARRRAEAAARAAAVTAAETAATTATDREIADHEAARIAAATAEGRFEGYRRGLRAAHGRLDARAEALGEEPQGWFRRLGARYNNMKWYNKLLITGGLIGGAATFGSLVPMLAMGAKAGLVAQRFAGFAGMFYKTEKSMENARTGTFFANRTNGQRTAMAAAFAGLYTLGAGKVIGGALNAATDSAWAHAATDKIREATDSSWGQTVTGWLRSHWPFSGGPFAPAATPSAGEPLMYANPGATEPPLAPIADDQILPLHADSSVPPASIDPLPLTNAGPTVPPFPIGMEHFTIPEGELSAADMTPADHHAALEKLLGHEAFKPEPAPMSAVPPHNIDVLNPPTLAETLARPEAPSVPLAEILHPEPLVPEQAISTPIPTAQGLDALHAPSLADTLDTSALDHMVNPEPLVAHTVAMPEPLPMTPEHPTWPPEVKLDTSSAAVPPAGVPLDHILNPEPLVAHDVVAPEHAPLTPQTVPGADEQSFAQWQQTHPAAEIPGVTEAASKGHGYEYMTKRLWEQLQDKHLDPTKYAEGSDLRRLIEAKDSNIDKVVHDIATERGFFHADGTNTLVDPKAHLSFGADGQLHFGDPAHNLDVVQSPEGAKTTAAYRPEAPQQAPVAAAESPDSHTHILYKEEGVGAPATEPHSAAAAAMEKVQADELNDPRYFSEVRDPDGTTHHYLVDENKKLREITIGEDGSRNVSEPIRDAYTPPEPAGAANAAEVSNFQVNQHGVDVDPSHATAGLDPEGKHIVAGGSLAERKAEALRIFNQDRTEVYYESTPEKHWWRPSPKVEVSKIVMASDGTPAVEKVLDRKFAPSIDDLKELYNPR